MTFVSLPFFAFVAVLSAIYFLTPKQFRWVVLLAGSYYFYWTNSRWLVLVLFATTMATFLIGLWIQRVRDRDQAFLDANKAKLSREERKVRKQATRRVTRRILLLGILVDLGALLYLKYFNFFAANANALLTSVGSGRRLPMPDWAHWRSMAVSTCI